MEDVSQSLEGKRVAFTGRLASLTRAEAVEVLQSLGGQFSPSVLRSTAFLVVGQEGWPLKKDGRLTSKLTRARFLSRQGFPIEILPEESFLQLARLHNIEPLCGRYSTAQLTQTLGIGRDRLRSWIRTGLLQPEETVAGVSYFDFAGVSHAKALTKLLNAGVSLRQIERSLRQLRPWLPSPEEFLSRLSRLEGTCRLALRGPNGEMLEPNGQRLLEFGGESHDTALLPMTWIGDNDLFNIATRHEEAGRYDEAADAYRQLLELDGPDTEVCYNLANVEYCMGNLDGAIAEYQESVELDPFHADAWYNLGNVLSDMERYREAIAAYRQTLEIDRNYMDAHFGLADALQELNCPEMAARHWQQYLAHDTESERATYARATLAQA